MSYKVHGTRLGVRHSSRTLPFHDHATASTSCPRHDHRVPPWNVEHLERPTGPLAHWTSSLSMGQENAIGSNIMTHGRILMFLTLSLVTIGRSASAAFVHSNGPQFDRTSQGRSTTLTLLHDTKVDRQTNKLSNMNIPLSLDEMIKQVATASREASQQGIDRQIVRILLPRDRTSQDLGRVFEEENPDNVQLVPPDESWQGGIEQLYRAAAPTASRLLRLLASQDVPPRINEDRSVDESGVDGVGLIATDDNKFACYVQPLQETIDTVEDRLQRGQINSSNNNNTTTILMNPQWRQVDDALDSASKQEGFFGSFASFLGGKGGALKRLSELGFKPTYTLEGYVCRGANVRILQILDGEWSVFCERDDYETFIRVGNSPKRPTYQEVDAMLENSNIGFKFRRDVGLEPKL